MNLRPATMDDADLLLAWRNDPATRASSFRTSEIAEGEHRRWLARTLHDSDCRVLIAVVGKHQVGMVRAERSDIGLVVAPEQRGKGYATRMIRKAVSVLSAEGFASHFEARIKAGNWRSASAFKRAGFRPCVSSPKGHMIVSRQMP